MSDKLSRQLLALLFVAGEPLSERRLAEVTLTPVEKVQQALRTLAEGLSATGLMLVRAGRQWQLTTAPEVSQTVDNFLKAGLREDLSPAAAETLAIIAYRGPLRRSEIEALRGVNSAFILRTLCIRGLIEKVSDPQDARRQVYRVTTQFLRHLGLQRVEQLPRYEELSSAEKVEALLARERGEEGKGREEEEKQGNVSAAPPSFGSNNESTKQEQA
jgi:segregation and condensation protein B